VTNYVVRRLLGAIPQLLIISFITFSLTRLIPGGPVLQDLEATLGVDQIELRRSLGLDEPIISGYFKWLGGVLRLDFDRSYHDKRPVMDHIKERLGITLQLTILSFIIGFGMSIPLGALAAYYRNRATDHAVTGFFVLGMAIPNFVLALLFILVFSFILDWFPSGGRRDIVHGGDFVDLLKHMIMPVAVIVIGNTAALTRYVRASTIEALSSDYVRTARAKGLGEWLVLFRHVLRNALLPAVTIFGNSLPFLFGGSLFVEQTFSWPGMGTLATRAARERDYPVTLALVLISSTLVLLGSLIADVLYGFLDPRISVER
jgi:peptide/nickel transport system permease protein